ncbi:homogentisate 1,2-dioxygenase [Ferrimicrobium sp.]|uniref:homogentisate 1,2-dioxygenase n=1 Tax=Ferrimicrobium sp. TaxID=2926050 RepID=UPI00260F6A68|nr:homogentisate 1,2-dioxygenase [Ferrimicrobium sp.]
MPFYQSVGEIPRKRHQVLRGAGGALIAEELMGNEGFTAESALLYHLGMPTAIVDAETIASGEEDLRPNMPLLPRHYLTPKLANQPPPAPVGRHLLLGNKDVRLSYGVVDRVTPLYRNATGDECLFVQAGRGRVETVFGSLEVREKDYIIIPASCTYRLVPEGDRSMELLVIEANGHIEFPSRYLSERGQLLESAPFSERDLRTPSELCLVDGSDVEVLVKTRAAVTRYIYARHPFDVIGWDGCLYPFVFNMEDFEPIVKRFHAPPPVHQTFEGPGFVICSFAPRPFDFDPESVPVPYNHANVDSDEVLFYVDGDFMSRKGSGIEAGSISLHPAGFIHGPQPGSVEAALGKPGTKEWAVMVDTFAPLELGSASVGIEDPNYPWSWSKRHGETEFASPFP